MAVGGGRSRIVQNCLIGDRDTEHRLQDESRLSRTEGEGDVKSQDQTENMRSVMDGP